MSDIFISYSHKDVAYLGELKRFLKPLESRIGFWSDGDISIGQDWNAEIERSLGEARIGLLLISQDFLDSEYITSKELPRLVQAAEDGTLKLAVLYLKTSSVCDEGCAVEIDKDGAKQRISLTKYQGFNSPGEPVGSLNPDNEEARNQLYLRVSQKLAELAKSVAGPQAAFRNVGDVPDEVRESLRTALPPNISLGPVLARGQRSIVYQALDQVLERNVAIKVIDPSKVVERTFDDYLNGVRIAGGLKHRSIMSVYASVHADRLLYTVTEYVDGITLCELVKKVGVQPMNKVLTLLERMADMLDYAHRNGFVHGSINPSHVMVDSDGWPMVSPFKLAADNSNRNGSGSCVVLETLKYQSPEQYNGSGEITEATDQYALGLIACELVTGRPVIECSLIRDLVAAKNEMIENPPLLAGERKGCPSILSETVLRMLDKNPAKRWPSMHEVIEQIKLARDQIRTELPPRLQRSHEKASESYQRFRGKKSFFEGFYARFLPKLEENVRAKFPMQMDAQCRMLREALDLLLWYPVEPRTPALEKLARAHADPKRLRLTENDYDQFMACLLATVKEHEDARGARGDQVASAWRAAMRPGIKYMKSFLHA